MVGNILFKQFKKLYVPRRYTYYLRGFLCYMINFRYAKSYCKDDISLIENYDKAIADKDNIWDCHHRREIETSRKKLIEIGEYFNRPASELIFLTKPEHKALHNTLLFKGNKIWLGKHHSEEAKRKMSEKHKGKTTWNKGKKMSEEAKQKMAAAKIGKHHSDETKRKMSAVRRGRSWFNNGIKSVWTFDCPEGFVRGMLKRKAI